MPFLADCRVCTCSSAARPVDCIVSSTAAGWLAAGWLAAGCWLVHCAARRLEQRDEAECTHRRDGVVPDPRHGPGSSFPSRTCIHTRQCFQVCRCLPSLSPDQTALPPGGFCVAGYRRAVCVMQSAGSGALQCSTQQQVQSAGFQPAWQMQIDEGCVPTRE